MARYYKQIVDGYIVAIGTGMGGTKITEAEYAELDEILNNKPEAPEGKAYRVTANGEYELADIVPLPLSDPDAAEILSIIFGGTEA